jgi:hypothetical protein
MYVCIYFIVNEATRGNVCAGGVTEDNFELLCLDGSRASVTAWERCNWGRVPADALVTSSAASPQARARYHTYLYIHDLLC